MLNSAEKLFAERGYQAVTLRDIASDIGIKHTSLYHHVPDGKEALYLEVMERFTTRHKHGMNAAIHASDADVRSRLIAVADWLYQQPPLDPYRTIYSDMPAIAPEHTERITDLMYEASLKPVKDILDAAAVRGEITLADSELVAGGLFGMMKSLFTVPDMYVKGSRTAMATTLIDMVLDGLRSR